ncbi:MAG TPA: hypothetical protein VMF90_13100 [Rhizobiaceae bacterium]|nr:hypothetical protein [Rhizobiaceae bacterium]
MFASLIAAVASGEIFGAIRRARGAAVAYALALLCGLTGIGFLIGAAFVAAARRWGTIEAAAGFGAGFLLLAILILVFHSLARRMRAERAAKQRSVDVATIAGAAAVSLLPLLMTSKKRGGIFTIVAPLIAVAAYAIYREHSPKKPDGADKL